MMKFLCRIIPAILVFLLIAPWAIFANIVWFPVCLVIVFFCMMFEYGCNQKIYWEYYLEKLFLPLILAYACYVDWIIEPISEANKPPRIMHSNPSATEQLYKNLEDTANAS